MRKLLLLGLLLCGSASAQTVWTDVGNGSQASYRTATGAQGVTIAQGGNGGLLDAVLQSNTLVVTVAPLPPGTVSIACVEYVNMGLLGDSVVLNVGRGTGSTLKLPGNVNEMTGGQDAASASQTTALACAGVNLTRGDTVYLPLGKTLSIFQGLKVTLSLDANGRVVAVLSK